MGYHKKAKELGASFFFGEEVTGREGRTVRTASGSFAGDHVVIAAGGVLGKLGGEVRVRDPGDARCGASAS
jgi:glycine/D-amino acid oxidase-like deaminating enzyme